MKKYLIKDEDNMSYEITEVDEEQNPIPEEKQPLEDDDVLNSLTPEEISVLKKLIPIADKLIALAGEEAEEDEIADEDEIDEEEEDIDEEEIIDTEAKDSINKSATSNKKKQKVNDSVEDIEDEAAIAWANRYQQFKKGKSDF